MHHIEGVQVVLALLLYSHAQDRDSTDDLALLRENRLEVGRGQHVQVLRPGCLPVRKGLYCSRQQALNLGVRACMHLEPNTS